MVPRKVRRLRLGLGLTQEKFARRLGVARVTATRWENGTRRPSRIAALAMRSAVGAKESVDWQNVAGVALNDLWDNPEDAIYDGWKAHYRSPAR